MTENKPAPQEERKLATVRTICAITPIKKADRIELATLDGWKCVVQKNEFRVGEKAVYFEIDSFLPEGDERFAFLTTGSEAVNPANGKRGTPIRSRVLKKTISQGLALPLALFPEIDAETAVGTDVTSLLGITKWERPIPADLEGEAIGYLSGWIRKTKQERIQNALELLEDDAEYEVSIKLDGYSQTIFNHEGQVGVASHEVVLKDTPESLFWRVAKEQGFIKVMPYLENIAIQGELIGEGINKNPEGIKGQEFRIFDIWDITEQRHYGHEERMEFVERLWTLGVRALQVPLLERTYSPKRDFANLEELLLFAAGRGAFNADKKREGVVFKRLDGTDSFKVIDNGNLLALEEPEKSKNKQTHKPS